jgi:argininosuccinate lyase
VLRERFSQPLDRAAIAFSDSTREDAELLGADLWGSRAHARMLAEAGLLPRRSARRIDAGLRAIERAAARGRFALRPDLEDVHLNVEAELTRRIGADGERLHTGRSRNDQVAVDLLVYLREALLDLEEGCARVAQALRRKASSDDGRIVVTGWTHLQPAQRVYVAQILGTHALRFLRDAERLRGIRERLTDCPLGSAALAGSSLPLRRSRAAELLGFARPNPSSLDAVSDRDPEVETLAALALLGVHASSLAEELVLGSMEEIARVRLADAFVTTSSLMPHKRNPDLAELVRAESGPSLGRLTAHLALLKGLPLAYNRDLQVGKPLLFEGIRRADSVLSVLAPMVEGARFSRPPASDDNTASVELVDALVRGGVPFRAAHRRVALCLATLAKRGRTLRSLGGTEFRGTFPEAASVGFRLPAVEAEPELRTTAGGSSWSSVRQLLRELDRRETAVFSGATRERRRLARVRRELDRPLPSRLRAHPRP